MTARAHRLPRVFDSTGTEVFITQVCTRCHRLKPLAAFGLRKMETGKIRSIPQCKACRGAHRAPGAT